MVELGTVPLGCYAGLAAIMLAQIKKPTQQNQTTGSHKHKDLSQHINEVICNSIYSLCFHKVVCYPLIPFFIKGFITAHNDGKLAFHFSHLKSNLFW